MAKISAGRAASLKFTGAMPQLDLDLPLDDSKVEAIQRCLAKGRLKISLTQVNLAAGRLGDGYKYD